MPDKFRIPVFVLLLLSIAFAIYLSIRNNKKIAYVDVKYIFENFDLKKEIQGKFQNIKSARDRQLDSMERDLNILAKEIELTKAKNTNMLSVFEVKKQEYFKKSKEFKEDNDALTEQYDNQILGQMNQLIKDYGKKHSYDAILGTEGEGNIMYATESMDITQDVLKYINSAYQGDAKK